MVVESFSKVIAHREIKYFNLSINYIDDNMTYTLYEAIVGEGIGIDAKQR